MVVNGLLTWAIVTKMVAPPNFFLSFLNRAIITDLAFILRPNHPTLSNKKDVHQRNVEFAWDHQ